MSRIVWLILSLLLLPATGLLLAARWAMSSQAEYAATATLRTTGVVVGDERRNDGDEPRFHSIVEYRGPDGQTARFTDGRDAVFPRYPRGQVVEVRQYPYRVNPEIVHAPEWSNADSWFVQLGVAGYAFAMPFVAWLLSAIGRLLGRLLRRRAKPKPARVPWLLLGVLLLPPGAWLVADAWMHAQPGLAFKAQAQRIVGTVTDLQAVPADDATRYRPVIEYAVAGKTLQYVLPEAGNPARYRRGEAVSLLVLPDDPERTRVDGLWSIWGANLLELVAGALLLVPFAVVASGVLLGALWGVIGGRGKEENAAPRWLVPVLMFLLPVAALGWGLWHAVESSRYSDADMVRTEGTVVDLAEDKTFNTVRQRATVEFHAEDGRTLRFVETSETFDSSGAAKYRIGSTLPVRYPRGTPEQARRAMEAVNPWAVLAVLGGMLALPGWFLLAIVSFAFAWSRVRRNGPERFPGQVRLSEDLRQRAVWVPLAMGLLVAHLVAWGFAAVAMAEIFGMEKTQGTIVEVKASLDETRKQPIYFLQIEYRDGAGQLARFGMESPQAQAVGDTVQVRHSPDGSRPARLAQGGIALLACVFFGAFTALFLVPFGWSIRPLLRHPWKARERRGLLVRGTKVKAQFLGVERHYAAGCLAGARNVRLKFPWRLKAQWRHPLSGKTHLLYSDPLWLDPAGYAMPEELDAIVDTTQPQRHWLDSGFLPDLADVPSQRRVYGDARETGAALRRVLGMKPA